MATNVTDITERLQARKAQEDDWEPSPELVAHWEERARKLKTGEVQGVPWEMVKAWINATIAECDAVQSSETDEE